jgi:dihydrofolate synthase/folylpolyglutamate synthase
VTARDLAAWLDHAERLHPKSIDLGLGRVAAVLRRLDLQRPPFTVLTVGGTNGKGSCVAFAAAILQAAGRRCGAYSSPHLVRYTERVRIAGEEIETGALAEAFAEVEAARDGLPLTYFEFGTLAALCAFRRASIEVAVLEVGLGGRLDAVNAVEPAVSVVTNVALDHRDLLGPDRESIGGEKAGILRAGRPAFCGDADPPAALLAEAERLGCALQRIGHEFTIERPGRGWTLTHQGGRLEGLPEPALAGAFQYANAACAIAATLALGEPLPRAAIDAGLRGARNPGRLQRAGEAGEVMLDVAHNPAAAAALAAALAAEPAKGRTLAVIGVLADKDASGIARALDAEVDGWFAAGLDGARGRSGADLASALRAAELRAPIDAYADVLAAHAAARAALIAGDRLLVVGSFHTVGAVLEAGLYSSPRG